MVPMDKVRWNGVVTICLTGVTVSEPVEVEENAPKFEVGSAHAKSCEGS